MEAQIKLREKIKPYVTKVMKEASENGSPAMRAMFYEFPEDEKCWNLKDQYMFGSDYLVAPVLTPQTFKRVVYLPAGKWENIHDGKVYEGGQTVTVDAPLEAIPVFLKK